VAEGPVRLERDGPLAVVTFDSPPLNLFTRELGQGIEDTMNALEAEPPRALLFRAEGKVVTGGVDVHLFKERAENGGQADDGVRGLLEQNRRVEALPYPTVFAAHALCLTWAFELALACDLLLAADAAAFGLVERRVGLTPGAGGTQRIAERAGPARARELVYTGEIYSAETLERWNVVNRVFPDEGFDQAARAFARELADGPTIAHGATKRIVRAFLEGGVAGADAVTDDQFATLFASEDLRNAVETFLTEGPDKATFQGR
jgi:enoyl-CoA hydratase/carnithine racemase